MKNSNSGPDPTPGQPQSAELSRLTDKELAENLRALTNASASHAVDRLQELVHELQVHRVELEMQNRALQDAQSELEHSVQRYADLYDHLPMAYLTVTSSGEIVHLNLAAAELLQRERTKLTGVFLGQYLEAYDAGRLAGHLEQCVKSGKRSVLDLTIRPGDGSMLSVQLNSRAAPTASAESPTVLVAITDITKLKQTQRTLEEINREQEAFNYSISHDLRAPLITINNYAGIVLSDYAAAMDEAGRAMVVRIRSAGVRMEETLKHLLEYSTLAREDIALGIVNTGEVIKELLIEHRALLDASRAEVNVELPIPNVRGCVPILNQVLANLLTNALKYTRDGETPSVRIFAETRPSGVVLRVADRGIGIEPKYHDKIFRIFERLHGYSKYPGSGVGLAIARRAVERMNGRIWVESEPGKGSTFCLELPKG